MEIEIQICCQFILIEQNMSFWTKYSIYNVNQNNIVLNDKLRIDPESNQFIIDDQNNHNDDPQHHDQNLQDQSINLQNSQLNANGNSSYISTINDTHHPFGDDIMESYQYDGIDIAPTNLSNTNNINGNASRSIGSGFSGQPPLPQFNVSRIMSASHSHTNDNNTVEQEAAETTPPDANIIVGDEQIGDNLLLESGMVRAWRYDEEQDKWRGRGKGNLLIYKNRITGIIRIVFKDVKHENKVRLLQKIDVSYEHCSTNLYQNEIEWNGNDYSMDPHEPLSSLWKLKFIDEPEKIQPFVTIFNDAVDDFN